MGLLVLFLIAAGAVGAAVMVDSAISDMRPKCDRVTDREGRSWVILPPRTVVYTEDNTPYPNESTLWAAVCDRDCAPHDRGYRIAGYSSRGEAYVRITA